MAGAISITDYDVDPSDLTTYTFAAQDIGAEASDRGILIGIGWREGTPLDRALSSATIGGVSAPPLRQDHVATGGTAIILAPVPTGTTAVPVLTFSAAVSRVSIAVARVTGCDLSAAFAAAGLTGGVGVTSLATNVNTPADGIAFGYQFITDVGGTPTLSWAGTDGLTSGTQQLISDPSDYFHARAGYSTTTSQTPRGITASAASTVTPLGYAASVISLSPASAGVIVGSGLTRGLKLDRMRLN